MVVTRIVDAIARKEIEDPAAIRGEQLRSHATFIAQIHLEQSEQLDPLRIYVVTIGTCGQSFSR
jgi:hypothetical protein